MVIYVSGFVGVKPVGFCLALLPYHKGVAHTMQSILGIAGDFVVILIQARTSSIRWISNIYMAGCRKPVQRFEVCIYLLQLFKSKWRCQHSVYINRHVGTCVGIRQNSKTANAVFKRGGIICVHTICVVDSAWAVDTGHNI